MGTGLKRYQTLVSDSARWAKFQHRPGDIIISTPPKCGTTLTQMMVALLLYDGPDFPDRLDDLSPWLDMNTRSDDEVLGQIEAMVFRRFLKTHAPLDGIPDWPGVSYIVVGRDPRDVFVSWEHHIANTDSDRFVKAIDEGVGLDTVMPFFRERAESVDERLDHWLGDDDPTSVMSLASVTGHISVSWERRERDNVHMFHFEELRDDRAAAMQRLADGIGVDTRPERIAQLAEAASLDRMRARADELAPNTKQIFSDSAGFFRSGQSGEGRALMSAEQEAVYQERMAELVSPALRDWLHRS